MSSPSDLSEIDTVAGSVDGVMSDVELPLLLRGPKARAGAFVATYRKTLYRLTIAQRDAATTDIGIAKRMKLAWKEWNGDEMAFGEPFESDQNEP